MDEWAVVAKYPTVFEAERAKAALEAKAIVARIQSHGGTGIFGAGFQGPVIGGAAVLVRSADMERAWQVVVDSV